MPYADIGEGMLLDHEGKYKAETMTYAPGDVYQTRNGPLFTMHADSNANASLSLLLPFWHLRG